MAQSIYKRGGGPRGFGQPGLSPIGVPAAMGPKTGPENPFVGVRPFGDLLGPVLIDFGVCFEVFEDWSELEA